MLQDESETLGLGLGSVKNRESVTLGLTRSFLH